MKDGYFKLYLTLASIMAVVVAAYFLNGIVLAWNEEARAAANHELYMKYLKLNCEKLEDGRALPDGVREGVEID